MKRIKLFVFAICAIFVAMIGVSAATTVNDFNSLSGAVANDGEIELSADITLTSTISIPDGKTVTIDLKGHKITGVTSGYSIKNSGTLTIKDTGSSKGQIYCQASSSSCIVNKDDGAAPNLTIDGVTISTNYVGIKNEIKGTLDVKNSIIDIRADNSFGYGIQSYGVTNIESTTFNTPNYLTSWYTIAVEKSSTSKTTLKNVDVTGNGGHIVVGQNGTGNAELIIDDLDLPRGITIVSYSGATVQPDAKTAEVTLRRANSGSTIVVPYGYTGENIRVTTGVTVVLETGTDPYKKIIKNEDGTYTIEYKDADYTDLYATISVAKGYDFSKYTDESVKALLEAIEDAENVEQGLKSNEQYKINNLRNAIITAIVNLVEKGDEPVKPGSATTDTNKPGEPAPDTFDAGLTYVGLALSAIGTSVVSVKKLRNN